MRLSFCPRGSLKALPPLHPLTPSLAPLTDRCVNTAQATERSVPLRKQQQGDKGEAGGGGRVILGPFLGPERARGHPSGVQESFWEK